MGHVLANLPHDHVSNASKKKWQGFTSTRSGQISRLLMRRRPKSPSDSTKTTAATCPPQKKYEVTIPPPKKNIVIISYIRKSINNDTTPFPFWNLPVLEPPQVAIVSIEATGSRGNPVTPDQFGSPIFHGHLGWRWLSCHLVGSYLWLAISWVLDENDTPSSPQEVTPPNKGRKERKKET